MHWLSPIASRLSAVRWSQARLLLIASCVACAAASAQACSIPVFRYALERWRPDLYEVLVFHRDPLTETEQALVERLAPEYTPGEPLPNTAVSLVELTGEVRPEFAAIWQEEQGASLPWVVARTPWKGENETIWSGPLTQQGVNQLLGSPQRGEIANRLLGGDSVVWVFLNSGDAERDAAAFALAEKELARLQQEIVLPEIRVEDLRDLTVDPDQLGLRFSLLRLDRNDPREQALVQSLLRVEKKLTDPQLIAEPMLFPVFGRGRVYFPLIGDAISALDVEDMARFLCGACQCTVKQQNPGLDLLTSVDWDYYIEATTEDRTLPPLVGFAGFDAEDSAAPMAATSEVHVEEPSRPRVSQPLQEVSAGAAARQKSEAHSADGDRVAQPATPSGGNPGAVDGVRNDRDGYSPGLTALIAGVLLVLTVAVASLLLPRRS